MSGKAAARAAARAARAAAFAGGQGGAAAVLAGVLAEYAGRLVSGYVPLRDEIDPLPALAGFAGPLCLPVVPGRGVALRFRRWAPGAALVPAGFGTQEPASGAWCDPEVLVVPLLAFDRRGYRLGYGGGYYDRTLAGLRAAGPVLAVGFAFAAQEVAAVPRDDHDQRLDLIVTEAGVIVP